MDEKQTKEMIQQTVKETVKTFGIDTEDVDHMNAFRDDLRFLREWRLGTNKLTMRVLLTVVTVVVGGAASAIWIGFKNSVGQ